jgi:hypothetical protein
MPEPSNSLLEHHLDAWGRAELHTASKQLSGPGPAFTGAVASEARRQRMLVGGILLAVLVVLLTLLAIAYHRAQPVPGSDDVVVRSSSQSKLAEALPLVR